MTATSSQACNSTEDKASLEEELESEMEHLQYRRKEYANEPELLLNTHQYGQQLYHVASLYYDLGLYNEVKNLFCEIKQIKPKDTVYLPLLEELVISIPQEEPTETNSDNS